MELYIEPVPFKSNPVNGQFLKGHIPFNKGKKWSEWMDGRKQRRVLKIGAKNLRNNFQIGGWNARKVVALKGIEFYVFDSAVHAAKVTGATRRNICHCCNKQRKHCSGFEWFFEDDNAWCNIIEERRNNDNNKD